MTIYRPELANMGIANLELAATNEKHIGFDPNQFLGIGNGINSIGRQIGADGLARNGTFSEAMLNALDGVSVQQQLASSRAQAAIIDPDSIDVHDVTIAQAKANLSLNIARNVLNRLVQSWRDVINTR